MGEAVRSENWSCGWQSSIGCHYLTLLSTRAACRTGPDGNDIIRGAASYVDRILSGAKPGDLPVQFPTRFKLTVNLKRQRRLASRYRSPSCCAPGDRVVNWQAGSPDRSLPGVAPLATTLSFSAAMHTRSPVGVSRRRQTMSAVTAAFSESGHAIDDS